MIETKIRFVASIMKHRNKSKAGAVPVPACAARVEAGGRSDAAGSARVEAGAASIEVETSAPRLKRASSG